MKQATLSYAVYLDKVYGAWLGKSIAGTIGAPFEGRKELFDYTYDPKAIEQMLPNDDLDLQVLWLHVLEQKGIHLRSIDLAEAFYRHYPFVPGEYAYFKKNYARGILPPLSGAFNNRYYINGMGCPIRSEIWACISPGNPDLAASFAEKDGVLDHAGDSVYAEQFLAAVEASAFLESDLERLLDGNMRFLPEGSRIRQLVEDTRRWSATISDWQTTRSLILRDYGHPDCTNLYQNIGFTLLALLYGDNDFIDTTMIALNCGFDTDCSCATAGALLGIIQGADYLIHKHGFSDTSYKLDVQITRRSNQLRDLAEDTCRAGLTVAEHLNPAIKLTERPAFEPIPTAPLATGLQFEIDYNGDPVIGWGESRSLTVRISNMTTTEISGHLSTRFPEDWIVHISDDSVNLAAGADSSHSVTVSVPHTVTLLHERNLFELSCAGYSASFGLNGAQVWNVYGPFWENHISLPHTELGESYYPYIRAENKERTVDLTRQYHLNTMALAHHDYIGEPGKRSLEAHKHAEQDLPVDTCNVVTVNIGEDLFAIEDLIGFQGPCVVYIERELFSPKEQTAQLLIGHTAAYKLWINDRLVSESDQGDWWTAENRHLMNISLRQGMNRLMMKAIRHGKSAEYSIIFTEVGDVFPHHLADLGSYTPGG